MPVDRRNLLRTGAMGAAAALAGNLGLGGTPQVERPNILWFTSEDNFPLIGAYGDALAHTPNIDLLAGQGVQFQHAYCVSPVCGPSRFSILTGMHPAAAGSAAEFGSNDEILPTSMRGYPAYFRDLGYYTSNNQKKNYNSQFDYVMDLWDESGEAAHWNKRKKEQPFFAVFNTFTTHESSLFTPRRGLDGKLVREGRFTPEMMAGKVPRYLPDTPGVRKDFASFYNAMEAMDGELAMRLKEVADAGLAEDTIVVYYSDNGGITPRGKRFCYELGMRCPLIVYFPPKWRHLSPWGPGSVVTTPVTLCDLMPSMLSIAGIRPPAHVQGKALFGPHRASAQRYAAGGRDRMDERYDLTRTITDTRFRYIRNYNPHRPWGQHVEFMFQSAAYQDWEAAHLAGTLNADQDLFWGLKPFEELYDLSSDPDQVSNLAGKAAYRAKLDELRRALDDHMLAINDNAFIPEGVAVQGYVNSRRPGAYPLRALMDLASKACSRDPAQLGACVKALDHENELFRHWGSMGLLIAGEGARPHLPRIKRAMLSEPSVSARIVQAEVLVGLASDRDALITLGTIIDVEDDGPFRLQALNALTYLGDKVRPILPAIRRSAIEDHRAVRKLANYIIARLEGTYDPRKAAPSPGGAINADPEHESPAGAGRLYD